MSDQRRPVDVYNESDFKRDLAVLEDRLQVNPQVFPCDDGRVVVRWDHADEPWLEYDAATLNRSPSDVADPAWQRDRPFWAVLDRADALPDAALLQAWNDARFAHHLVKEQFRFKRLGMDPGENMMPVEVYRAQWDAEQAAGRAVRATGVTGDGA